MGTYTPSRAPESPIPFFQERNLGTTVKDLALSHLSIEVGHFYMETLDSEDEAPIIAQFKKLRPWLDAARSAADSGGGKPRVSTCFLIDDYFQRKPDPKKRKLRPDEIMERLLRLAKEAGVEIDYVARESACARRRDGFAVAELVVDRLLEEAEPGKDTGGRPPAKESGWLSNGKPSRELNVLNAMENHVWEAPLEYGMRNHSIYVDVEMWRDGAEPGADEEEVRRRRLYSCPFLASVWQLVRLGLLRENGEPALTVTDFDGEWRTEWNQFPEVIKVNRKAQPFYAYSSLSIMPQLYLPIETAVRTVIDHFLYDRDVARKLDQRAAKENITLPDVISERISHHFLPGGK